MRTSAIRARLTDCLVLVATTMIGAHAVAAQPAKDPVGSADVPWLGRYEGASIVTFVQKAFDEARVLQRLPRTASDTGAVIARRGRRSVIVYQAPKGRSSLEVAASYQTRLDGLGFRTDFRCESTSCTRSVLRIAETFGTDVLNTLSFSSGFSGAPRYALYRKGSNDAETLVALYIGENDLYGPRVAVQVLEPAALDASRVTATANDMQDAIAASGRVALYGFFFETGDATVAPASEPLLAEIVRLLQSDATLNLLVVGHTDNQGDFAANVTLSERRAAAVVAALVRRGVDSKRLTPFGAGMAAPAAPNLTEAQRAKNRRVELVRR